SVYMFGTFLALALGQLLIGQAEVETVGPFNAIAVLFAVALVIVSTTRAEPPRATPSTSLPFGQLSRAALVAVDGCIVSGLVSASWFSLVPASMEDEGVARATIATFMLIAVVGGLAFQVPIGRLSDQFDRRIVLSLLSFGFAVAAIAVVNLPHSDAVILPAAALLGGFMSTLYPVCVANGHDQLPAVLVTVGSGVLVLVIGLGAMLGQRICANLMARCSIDEVFYFLAAAGRLLAPLAAPRRLVTAPPTQQERTFE